MCTDQKAHRRIVSTALAASITVAMAASLAAYSPSAWARDAESEASVQTARTGAIGESVAVIDAEARTELDTNNAPQLNTQLVPEQPFREFLVAANPPVVNAAISGATFDQAAKVKRCQQFFSLPFGPVARCSTAIVGSAVGAVLTTGAFQWWKRGFSSHITKVNEGGFGRETYTGGVDKLSHAYTFYIGTRLVNDALQWGGASKTEAMLTSALANAGTAALIELFDGYSKKTYGFSREDLVADAVGIIMGSAVNAFPDLDRKFSCRMRYFPKGAGGSANFIDSYEGQTYFLTARLSGFANLSPKNPLRYLELVFGYRGTGFKPRIGIPGVDYARHERRTYYGVGLNVEEILRGTVFAENAKPTRIQAVTEGILTYVQLPGTVFAKTHAF